MRGSAPVAAGNRNAVGLLDPGPCHSAPHGSGGRWRRGLWAPACSCLCRALEGPSACLTVHPAHACSSVTLGRACSGAAVPTLISRHGPRRPSSASRLRSFVSGVDLIWRNHTPENLQKNWLREFYQVVHTHKPHFMALHCQEFGGKNYEASMSHVDKFVKELLSSDAMKEYNRARVYLDENFKSQEHFTPRSIKKSPAKRSTRTHWRARPCWKRRSFHRTTFPSANGREKASFGQDGVLRTVPSTWSTSTFFMTLPIWSLGKQALRCTRGSGTRPWATCLTESSTSDSRKCRTLCLAISTSGWTPSPWWRPKHTAWDFGTYFLPDTSFLSCPQIRLRSVRPGRRLSVRTFLTRPIQHQLAFLGSQELSACSSVLLWLGVGQASACSEAGSELRLLAVPLPWTTGPSICSRGYRLDSAS
ncbi:inositol polyphosphate-5-phosphatase A isoform X10 [Ailuropoda melanoleuca]|uniref:inositol polyphosphate-5-phosphatase A isoform X10 n=1 Tax=Ailuropoda melanoleuca TaxID=9646 RepID=UPI001494A125|nr:inositol polyphosphate-5-phosphatase A isoform X10 [Ailuropoda melanoleuca]